MKFENQTFDFFMDESSGRVFSDIEFVNCRFVGGGFSSISLMNFEERDLVALRSTARRIRLVNCTVESVGFVGPGIVEDSILDGLKVSNHTQTCGAVFKHVTVKGTVDKLMINPTVDFTGSFPNVQCRFDEANREYYKTVDWALDISRALFKDCDIRGVPARLIRRDPETQVVLTREKAVEGGWRELDLSGTHWATAIQFMLDDGLPDCVLVAPKQSKNFKKLLEGLNKLRKAGIVQHD